MLPQTDPGTFKAMFLCIFRAPHGQNIPSLYHLPAFKYTRVVLHQQITASLPPKNISLLDAKGVIALGGADISPMRFLNTTAPIPSSLAETSGLSCHCQACQVSPATVTLSKMLHIHTRMHVLK